MENFANFVAELFIFTMIEHFVFHFMIDEKLFIKLQSLMNKYIVLSKTNEDNQFLLTLSCRPLLENHLSQSYLHYNLYT
mgnify:CR=1 FL=1